MIWQVNNHCDNSRFDLFDLSFIFEISIFYFYSLGCVPRFLKIFDFFSCIFPRENAPRFCTNWKDSYFWNLTFLARNRGAKKLTKNHSDERIL